MDKKTFLNCLLQSLLVGLLMVMLTLVFRSYLETKLTESAGMGLTVDPSSGTFVEPEKEVIKTSKVETMNMMFFNCQKLTSLQGLNCFNTSQVKNMDYMLAHLYVIPSLDVASFDVRNVTTMKMMFGGAFALQTIYVNNTFSTSSVSSSEEMFWECNNLVGAVRFNPSRLDASMANYTNGYFTYQA